ncbi:MAG: Trp biosynthesis-associated membrane protein [Microbacterium gubbeenense]|uniref:Trp biosynthesis-associated membrane protein n=1 Tax=Microbacterium gubbeenense TaxID=159896 RepID=UPI0004095ADA|nr:Trp biosynthesis-associated membrane protein [Microbacterium gubbeenense]
MGQSATSDRSSNDGVVVTARRESWVSGRGRLLSVLVILTGGALALISSTQTWATTELQATLLEAKGADALSLLQPLALAALALSLALALAGRIVRMVLAAIAVVLGVGLTWISAAVVFGSPVTAVESTVTEHTGIAGTEGVASVVSGTAITAWPVIALVCGVVVAIGGAFALATGLAWRRGGHRYDAAGSAHQARSSGPLDAVDSWDDLSRGDDPTDRQ